MPTGPVLELKHLQMIQAIAKHGRVTDAASALGLTPSALSHRIREAERRLDVALFTRLHKRLRMTPAGELLADVADRMIGDLERAEADVRRMNAGVAHVVRIAVETYSAYHWLPSFLEVLQTHHPGIELQVMAAAGQAPIQALLERNVDLIIASEVPDRVGLKSEHLFEDELRFIMPPNHPLAGRPYVSGPDVVGENFITTTKTPAPDREFARLFRPQESYPRWTAAVELPEAIVELVAAGQGTSVLAGWAIRPAIASGRMAAARVGEAGILISWQAVMRAEDADQGPIAEVARLLLDWSDNGTAFGQETEQ